jgi:hypothetical protein
MIKLKLRKNFEKKKKGRQKGRQKERRKKSDNVENYLNNMHTQPVTVAENISRMIMMTMMTMRN